MIKGWDYPDSIPRRLKFNFTYPTFHDHMTKTKIFMNPWPINPINMILAFSRSHDHDFTVFMIP